MKKLRRSLFNILLIFVSGVFLSSCDRVSTSTDQCLRREIFKQCMESLPEGPEITYYNDWSEVVAECGNQAYYQSIRSVSQIKPECR